MLLYVNCEGIKIFPCQFLCLGIVHLYFIILDSVGIAIYILEF